MSNLSTESFEGLTATNTQDTQPISTNHFNIIPSTNTIIGVWDYDPGDGPHATDGMNFIRANIVAGSNSSTDLTFQFNAPIKAFGLAITDFGDRSGANSLFFSNEIEDNYNIATGPLTNGNAIFFGVLNTTSSFTSVTFNNNYPIDGTGYDGVLYSPVPIPSAIFLLTSGLIGLIGSRLKKIV